MTQTNSVQLTPALAAAPAAPRAASQPGSGFARALKSAVLTDSGASQAEAQAVEGEQAAPEETKKAALLIASTEELAVAWLPQALPGRMPVLTPAPQVVDAAMPESAQPEETPAVSGSALQPAALTAEQTALASADRKVDAGVPLSTPQAQNAAASTAPQASASPLAALPAEEGGLAAALLANAAGMEAALTVQPGAKTQALHSTPADTLLAAATYADVIPSTPQPSAGVETAQPAGAPELVAALQPVVSQKESAAEPEPPPQVLITRSADPQSLKNAAVESSGKNAVQAGQENVSGSTEPQRSDRSGGLRTPQGAQDPFAGMLLKADLATAPAANQTAPAGSAGKLFEGRPVDHQELVRQVRSSLETGLHDGKSTLRVHLSPEHLGGIDLRVTTGPNGASVMIRAENPATGRLLEQHLNSLRDSLQEAGVQLNGLAVGQQPSQHGEFLPQHAPQHSPFRRGPSVQPAVAETPSLETQRSGPASATTNVNYLV